MLPYFRVLEGPARPVVEMEGAERIMLGSQQLPRAHRRRARHPGRARRARRSYGTGLTGSRLLNGTTPLHLELEAEIAEWMGTDDAIVFTTGHQANVGTLGTILAPGDTVVADSGDHASILDGCLLSRAKLRPFRHNRMDKLERTLEKAAGDGGGILVVVDGVFSMEGDIAPLPEICDLCERFGARLMVDEAHARRRARRARRGRPRSCSASRTASTCGWARSRSRWPAAAASSPAAAEVIEFLRIQSRAFLFTASGVPAAVGAALAALRIVRTDEGRALLAPRARQRALPARRARGARLRGRRAAAAARRRRADVVTPIVPVLVGDDWKAVLLWRASTTPACSSTPRCTPPCRRAARCCARA